MIGKVISDAARAIAANPFVELDLGVLFSRTDLDEVTVCSSKWPIAAVVVPLGETVDDLEAAVAASRDVARASGDTILAWWIGPGHDHLAAGLEELGLVHGDAPGFESVETSMALDHEPEGGRSGDVDVRLVETFEDFAGAGSVIGQAFGLPAVTEAENRRLFADYSSAGNTGREYVALDDGEAVGAAFAVAGDGAVNLFGGGVLPEARGHGVYRALVWARWEDAVELGTPVLTVQAGRQSGPILERLGFRALSRTRVFVDALG